MAHTTGTHTASGSSAGSALSNGAPIWFGSHCVLTNDLPPFRLPLISGPRASSSSSRAPSFAPPPPPSPVNIPSAASGYTHSSPHIPLLVPPSCLVRQVDNLPYLHLATPLHNPFRFIRQAIAHHRNNPAFGLTSSTRGVGRLSFPNAEERLAVTGHGPIHFQGNTLFFEHPEHADNRSTAIFIHMAEIEAFDFPDELSHPEGVDYFFSHLGDFVSADQHCFQGDYSSVRALVMVARDFVLPPCLMVRLPDNDIVIVKLESRALFRHGSDASPFSSEEDDDASLSSLITNPRLSPSTIT